MVQRNVHRCVQQPYPKYQPVKVGKLLQVTIITASNLFEQYLLFWSVDYSNDMSQDGG